MDPGATNAWAPVLLTYWTVASNGGMTPGACRFEKGHSGVASRSLTLAKGHPAASAARLTSPSSEPLINSSIKAAGNARACWADKETMAALMYFMLNGKDGAGLKVLLEGRVKKALIYARAGSIDSSSHVSDIHRRGMVTPQCGDINCSRLRKEGSS